MKLIAILVLVLLAMPLALAGLGDEMSDEDKEIFDEMLEPVMKIYNFLKYAATIIAALFMVFAAISFMTAGDDQRKRDNAKKSISYVIMGLIVIWVIPYAINFLVA